MKEYWVNSFGKKLKAVIIEETSTSFTLKDELGNQITAPITLKKELTEVSE